MDRVLTTILWKTLKKEENSGENEDEGECAEEPLKYTTQEKRY